MKLKYQFESIQELANFFEQKAQEEAKTAGKARNKGDREKMAAVVVTWSSAADIVRNAIIEKDGTTS